MEFPEDIKKYILSYLPRVYRKTLHVNAINRTPLFADFTIERMMMIELEDETNDQYHYIWLNSFLEYKKWRKIVNGIGGEQLTWHY